MVNTQLKILRVFGPTAAEVSAVLRQARADGCPGLRLLERDGEFAVCIQISAPNRAMAEQYCEKWALRLRAKFGDDVFAEGETSLAQATLSAMLDRRKLLVAVDETTGRLLGSQLQPLPHSEAVFDFGTETYAHPENRKQIVVPPVLLKRFPGDVVQASAGRRCPPPLGRVPLCWCATATAPPPAPCRRICAMPPSPTRFWTCCAAACWGCG